MKKMFLILVLSLAMLFSFSLAGEAKKSSTRTITCYTAADCGISTYIGEQFCENGFTKQFYKQYYCNQAGKKTSYCSYVQRKDILEDDCECNGMHGRL
jgi:hypothetical protein